MRVRTRGISLMIVVVLALLSSRVKAVTLPAIYNNQMVLQQNSEITIWGWGKPHEEVSITGSWDSQTKKMTIGPNSKWEATLKTPVAGGPYTITIKGYNTIVLEDILIGEVWLVSGQSNMEWTANLGIDNAEEEVKNANHPRIRFFTVAHRTADHPQIDLAGSWTSCTPETMQHFSAAAYFFAREIQKELDVPVGIINSSWGGTPAEVWMRPSRVIDDAELAKNASEIPFMTWSPREPGKSFHAMIAPLIPFKIAGTLWYQGETNVLHPVSYTKLLSALIKNWREEWGYEFPFYYAQIAPYKNYKENHGALMRDAQRLVMLNVPHTGMVVTSDIGNIHDIHPRNKQDVGKRFAYWALHHNYGKKDIAFSGPVYRSMKVEGKRIRLFFDHIEKGLMVKGRELTHFEIAGADKKFVKAKATISGNSIIVEAKEVKAPVAVRFAMENTAEPNLFNKEGLPASCFRTDNW